ncbi:hypothetical protein KAR28_06900, partial [Candidatus Parcubacteria bacterium]|nr:hypothetical protein [Candidatus Parcubacteria bacterium]
MGKILEYKNYNQFLKEAKKISWKYLIFRNQSILLNSLMLRGYSTKKYYKEIFDIDYAWKNIVFINHNVFFDTSDQKEIQDKFKKINSDQITGFIKDCYKRGDKIIKYSERIRKINLSKISTANLFELLENFKKELMVFSVYIIFPLYSHEKLFEEKIKSFIKKNDIKNIENIVSDLTYPKKKNFNYYEQIDLFNLAIKINNSRKLKIIFINNNTKKILKEIKDYPNILKAIKNHIKKYGWIQCRNYYGKEWSLVEMLDRIKIILRKAEKKKKDYLEFETSMRKKYKVIIEKLKIKNEMLKVIELSKEFTYLRTYRSDVFHMSGFNIRNLLTEIGKRFEYNLYDMIHMDIDEILNLSSKNIKRKDLEERKRGFAEIMVNTKMNLFWGKDLKMSNPDLTELFFGKLFGKIFNKMSNPDLTEL